MPGISTQDVLARSGRAGWDVVSVRVQTQKNPIAASDWGNSALNPLHYTEAYPAEVPTSSYVIQVKPPAGSGLASAPQEIVIKSAADPVAAARGGPVVSPDQIFAFGTKYGKDVTGEPLWDPGSIIAPDKAPTGTTGGATTAPSAPADQWPQITGPNGQVGVQEKDVNGNLGQVHWFPAGTEKSPQLIRSDNGNWRFWDPAKPGEVTDLGTQDPAAAAESASRLAASQASTAASGASTAAAFTRMALDQQQLAFDKETDPLKKQQLQANIAITNAQLAKLQQDLQKGNAPQVVSTNTDAPYIVSVDINGKLSYQANPNYRKQTQAQVVPGADATAPFLPVLVKGDDGSFHIEQLQNPGGMTVDAALMDFTGTLKKMLGPGDHQVPLSVAKDLATQVVNGMNATTTRAQVGAGLLNQRSSAGAGVLNNVLGLTNNKNFGLGGPLPSGMGAGILGGIQSFVTGLGGGQSVYDAALNMVHAANPALIGTQDGAHAVAVVTQMLQAGQGGAPAQTGFTSPTASAPSVAARPAVPAFQSPMGASSAPPTVQTPQGAAAPNELSIYGR